MKEKTVHAENVFLKYLLEPQLADQAKRFFHIMLRVNDAHVLMLLEQGIISNSEAKQLLELSQDIKKNGIQALNLVPEKEELYLNMEAHIIERLGDYVGGKLHTGRSRNDLYATMQRIKCRDAVLDIAEQEIELRETLLGLAEENLETIIPGYTHMQPAQPITFGYYLAALSHALERDFDRLTAAYTRTNLNPLGAGALAGTGFNIDRTLTGKYLGFDGVLMNALDAVASRDYVADIVFAMTMLLSDIGRMNQDFYFWVTSEFSTLKLPDEFVASSSIMPQKRNPIIFEHSISKVSHLLGAFVSIMTTMKGIPYTHSRATSGDVFTLLWGAFGETETTLKWMTALLNKIEINEDNALMNTKKNFSTATEVADEMVRKMDVSFRTAYQIVKRAVLGLYHQGKTSEDLTLEELNEAAMAVIQKPLQNINADDIEKALDPLENVKRRNVLGGPAPTVVAKDIVDMRNRLQRDVLQIKEWRKKIELAENNMREKADQVIRS